MSIDDDDKEGQESGDAGDGKGEEHDGKQKEEEADLHDDDVATTNDDEGVAQPEAREDAACPKRQAALASPLGAHSHQMAG